MVNELVLSKHVVKYDNRLYLSARFDAFYQAKKDENPRTKKGTNQIAFRPTDAFYTGRFIQDVVLAKQLIIFYL